MYHERVHSRPGAGAPTLERRATFPPDATSPGMARRLLREAVSSCGHEEWLDVGELVISEVVTNATLHARTPIEIALAIYRDCLCVEVKDGNPMLPTPRHYDDQATTGRGLGLVASLASEYGTHSLGQNGKVVWFCVGDREEVSPEDLLASWDLGEPSIASPAPTANVVLRAMPATLWLSARQHHDAILREFTLYVSSHPVDVDFAAADRSRTMITDALTSALEHAHDAGLSRPPLPDGHPSPLPWVPQDLDLELCIPPDESAAFLALQDALDSAEQLALHGQLLSRPALPEIVAVRDWACEQVVAQLAGIPPVPWPGTAQERFETETNARLLPGPTWDVSIARDSERGVVAADDANRIVAVSRPLAALLGWEVDDLVGRRVVTIIPPALREAHVAGFTRHLSTGEAHVLGVPIELPVLHADGREILCRFLVEHAPSNPGRSIYLAWIEPLGD